MALPVRAVNSMVRIHTLRLVAIMPVLIAAVFNTGYQYLLALDALALDSGAVDTASLNLAGSQGAGDWRFGLIQFFNVANTNSDAFNPGFHDMLIAGLVHVLPVFAMAFLVGGVWARIFAVVRNRRFDIGVIYTALLFTLLMPPGVSFFHIAFGMSFAVVIANAIFGGEGKTFLSPALVGVAVVQISFPSALTDHPLWTGINGFAGTESLAVYHGQGMDGLLRAGIDWSGAFLGSTQGLMGSTSVLAVMFGAAILMVGHIASWRLFAGQLIGVFLMAALCNNSGGGILDLPWYWHVVLGSFAFGAVFIATDPSSSAATDSGRWVQGILLGGLVVLIRVVNPSHPDGVIPVLLLVSILAPLIDHVVMWFNIRRRALGHG